MLKMIPMLEHYNPPVTDTLSIKPSFKPYNVRKTMPTTASLHPLIVHAPLVLIPAAVVFTLLSLFWSKGGLRIAAALLLAAGVATAVLATETGEAAEHRAEQMMPELEDISDPGSVPQAVAEGSLLETHAQLGEMTRNIYGLLLLIEGGLLFLTEPMFARLRGGRSLPAGVARLTRGLWTTAAVAGLALVVLTGHYGGKMVYDHGVGTTRDAQTTSSVQTP